MSSEKSNPSGSCSIQGKVATEPTEEDWGDDEFVFQSSPAPQHGRFDDTNVSSSSSVGGNVDHLLSLANILCSTFHYEEALLCLRQYKLRSAIAQGKVEYATELSAAEQEKKWEDLASGGGIGVSTEEQVLGARIHSLDNDALLADHINHKISPLGILTQFHID